MRTETRYPNRSNKRPLCLVIRTRSNPPVKAAVEAAKSCSEFMAKATGRNVRAMFVPACQASLKQHGDDVTDFPEPMRAEMLLKLLDKTGFDAGVTNCEMGEDRTLELCEILDILKQSDPGMDYMPVISRDKLQSVHKFADLDRILSENGLLVAVTDGKRCSGGHKNKQAARELIDNDPVFGPYSKRIYITDRTDLSAADNNAATARLCLEAGDYDGVASYCGYFVTKMLETWALTRKYIPEFDWYMCGQQED